MRCSRATLVCGVLAATLALAAEPLPNPSFEEGDQAPKGWRLEGKGAWEAAGRSSTRAVSVAGTGKDSGCWRTDGFRLDPNQLYQFSFWAKADRPASGCLISGPSFCNHDFSVPADWQQFRFLFLTPAEPGDGHLRLGQWEVPTRVVFDDADLKPAQAVHERFGDVVLGDGEAIEGSRYTFAAPLEGPAPNFARPLHSFRCGFNSSRWSVDRSSEVVYRHAIAGHKQTAVTVEISSSYFKEGLGVVAVSKDGQAWTPIGRLTEANTVRAEVPATLLPADALFVRITAEPKAAGQGAYFQLTGYAYTATLDADLGHLLGATTYTVIERTDPTYPVTILDLPSTAPDSKLGVEIRTPQGQGGEAVHFSVLPEITTERGKEEAGAIQMSVNAGTTARCQMGLALRTPGLNTLSLVVRKDNNDVFRATAQRHVAILHDASYGYLLNDAAPCPLWWCEGTYKVSQARALPAERRPIIELAAARNEYEPVQLVLQPKAELKNVRVTVVPLKSDKATLAAEHICIEQVAYVPVTRPTDGAGCRGAWPDPLPPFEQGVTLAAGRNHPIWITVYVPPDQPAGDYRGEIALAADGWQAAVPVLLRVWDFALPKMATLQSGFGLDIGAIRRYHNLEADAELRQVVDLYHRNFAAHRIAPYDPAPLDPIRFSFPSGPWEGGSLDARVVKEGRQSLRVVDDKPGASISAETVKPIPVDAAKRYLLAWWVKTAKPDQHYLVTVQQYGADGQWLSGNNVDIEQTGTGEWQRIEALVPGDGNRPLNPQANSVRISLRPAPWSERGEAMGTAWFDDLRLALADGGPNLLPDPGFEQQLGELKAAVDFTAWDKAADRTLGELGFNSFNFALRGMGGGTFQGRYPGRIGSHDQGTPAYEALMASQGRQVVEHFRQKGWLDRAYMYWFDEPDKKDYEFVVEGMKLIQRAAPGLRRMLTEQPEPDLRGHVDLWCPVVSAVDAKTIAERKQHGERFWWYLCCGPRAPFIGLFIDHPAVDLRVWAWLSRKWGVEGQLVWTTNWWTSPTAFPPPDLQNPWDDPMGYVADSSLKPGQRAFWGNGDGRFLYPPNRHVKGDRRKHLAGPVNSVRWELLREGFEDYEYFVLLDKLIAQAKANGKVPADLLRAAESLATVPDAVIATDRSYSKDPAPLHQHRRQVAEMVERLSRGGN